MKGGARMSKYDGPSYFKKSHPKIKSINETKDDSNENKKVSWTDQDDYFKTPYEETIPDSFQKRTAIQQKAVDYMQAPTAQSSNKVVETKKTQSESSEFSYEPPYRFRNKYIPASLQHLDGWKNNNKNYTLIAEVEKRLEKETNAYLLFEEYLAPEIKEALEANEQPKQRPQKKAVKKKRSKNYDPQTMKKVERVKEDLESSIQKPNTGLHRSLSGIIAEDQEFLNNRKSKLGSLFSDKD